MVRSLINQSATQSHFWFAKRWASGFCDIVCEADLKPYDYMALVPIIEGAGGLITDWEGQPLSWDASKVGAAGEVLAAGDAQVHAQALEVLRSAMHGRGATAPS